MSGDVLGQDGDAALALQVVGVEDALALCSFALAELAALAQHLVDQRGLAVVDVGDDGDVANVVTHLVHDYIVLGRVHPVADSNGRPREEGGTDTCEPQYQRRCLSKVCLAGPVAANTTRLMCHIAPLVSPIVTPESPCIVACQTVELWA